MASADAYDVYEQMHYLCFHLEQQNDAFVARLGNARFQAEDPVAVLGLIKLAETRRPWGASDSDVDDALAEFDL